MDSLGFSDTGNLALKRGDHRHDSVTPSAAGHLSTGVLELSNLLQTTLEVDVEKLEAGEVWVTFLNFRTGIEDKTAIS